MKSFIQLLSGLILIFAATGCGDGSSSSGGAGGVGGGGATGGGGAAGDGPTLDPVPILEKTPAISHDCVETRAMEQELGAMSMPVQALAELGGAFFELRAEDKLTASAIGLDGQLGAPVDLVSQAFTFRAPTMVSDGASLAAVWSAVGDTETITFARLDATLALVAGPTELPATTALQSAPAALVPDGGGYALFYGASNGSDVDLSFLRLDADGHATGDPVSIAHVGQAYVAQAAATPTGDGGFALAFNTGDFGATEVDFTIVDAGGKPRFAPRRISAARSATVRSSLPFAQRRSVIKVGDRYWVTFTETDADYEKSQGHTIVRVAVVDQDGAAVLSALDTPVDQDESSWPSFEPFGGLVGLTWTKGHIIWVCAGCVSDHDMHFVLLDPDTLAPASQVVTHQHLTNGITAPLVASSGADLLTAGGFDFHAVTLAASGAMRCDPAN